MKIIHTGDWHIGKQVNNYDMTPDQAYVMEQIYQILEEERPDVLIIAGDLYDRSIPPLQAVELLNTIFSKIIGELKIPTVALAGNHDSSERIEFGSNLFVSSGLYMNGLLQKEVKKITLEDKEGPVNFYLIPYAAPAVVRELFNDNNIKNNDDAMRTVIEEIKKELNQEERNVAIAHGYITYQKKESEQEELIFSDSEVGGIDRISASYFDIFDYTALGHLHAPQKVGSDKIRYAGSLLKYSFSEIHQKKGLTVIELGKKGVEEITFRKLKPRREMRVLKGQLEELIKPEAYEHTNREDYFKIILTDEGELLDPVAKLKAVYPNMMEMQRENKMLVADTTKIAKNLKQKTTVQLFLDFYEEVGQKECDKDTKELIEEIITQVERGDTI